MASPDRRGGAASEGPTGPGPRSLLEQAAMHAPDPLLLADRGELSWISPSVSDSLGWSPIEVAGRSLVDLCHPDDQGALAALITAGSAGGVHRGVVRMRAKGGRYVHVLATLARGNGAGSGTIAATIREIDQRIAREQTRNSLLDWHREINRKAGEALVQVDDTGHVTWASPTISGLLGWPPDELIGKGAAELAHPQDEPRLRAAWTGSHDAGTPLAFRCASKDGTWKWLEARSQRLSTLEDEPELTMSRLRDIGGLMDTRAALEAQIAHHRSIIDAIIDPFVVFEAVRDDHGAIVDFVLTEANLAACQAKDIAHDDLVGTRLLDGFPAGWMTALFDEYALVIEGETPLIRNSWPAPIGPDGGNGRTYDLRAVKFDDGIAQTWRDVTAQAEAADLIARSEARLRAVMDAMVDPQLLSEPIRAADGTIEDFIIEDANVEACAYLGATLEQLTGRTLKAVLPELLHSGLFQQYAAVSETGNPALLDDVTHFNERLAMERSFDIRCTQVQGDQINLTWRDITERQQDRQRLADSEEQLRAIMDAAPVGMAKVGLDGRFEKVNPALCRMLMHDQEWLKRHGIADVIHPEDALTHDRMSDLVAHGNQVNATWEERLVRADGHTIWALHSLAAIRNASGAITSYVCQFEDVSDAHHAHERVNASERLFRLVAENSSDVVAHLREGAIAWISPSVARVLGGSPADWLGREMRNFIHPFDLRVYDEALSRALAGQALIRRTRICTNDGSYHWVEAHVAPFRDESGRLDGVSASMRNVDVEVQALAELDRQARVDTLTGLVTRREAMRRLEEVSGQQREPGGAIALLFCDIDYFKDINDRFGHAAGDTVLRTLATRISEAVRLDDVVARMGGDELLVLISGVHELTEATEVAEKVRQVATAPIDIDGEAVTVSLSIGATLAVHGEPAEVLIARADAAMYQAKHSGRNQVAALAAPVSGDSPSPDGRENKFP